MPERYRRALVAFLLAVLVAAVGLRVDSSVAYAVPEAERVEVVSVSLRFSRPFLTTSDKGYTRVSMDYLPHLSQPGLPSLPYKTLQLVIPPKGDVSEIHITSGPDMRLPMEGQLETAPFQRPISHPQSKGPRPQSIQERLWPAERYQIMSERRLHGYRLLLLRLYPIRYDKQDNALLYTTEIDVRIVLEGALTERWETNATDRGAWRKDLVASRVDNPQDLVRFGALPLSRSEIELEQTDSLVDPEHPSDYVIITSRELSRSLEPLVAWREAQGLSVGVFHVEDIAAAYDGARPDGGDDDATRIRNFVLDAYTSWADSPHPLRYLLLAGDDEVIPSREMRVIAGIFDTESSGPLVSDAYYAGLDGTWDDDLDGQYGEGAAERGGTGDAGEEADLRAELFVGRVPASDVADATRWVSKTLAYEGTPMASYLHRGLWLGERLDSSTYGGDSKDLILDRVTPLSVNRLYESVAPWSGWELREYLNDEGAHVLNHLGHANSSHVMQMAKSDVSQLTNEYPFLVHSQGCLAAAFARGDAIAEHFVTDEHGAFAFVGNTSYGWYVPDGTDGASQMYDWEFFDALYREDIRHLGWALQDAKEDLLDQGAVGAVGPERWVYLELVLLGDPYTPFVTDYVQPMARIEQPARSAPLTAQVGITGTTGPGTAEGAGFTGYSLFWGHGHAPGEWNTIAEGSVPVTDGSLGMWNTDTLPDGNYTLRLHARDGASRASIEDVAVRIDHTHISSPADGAYLNTASGITLRGNASCSELKEYVLDFGYGASPSEWTLILSSTTPVSSSTLGHWDISTVDRAGSYTVRLRVRGGGYSGEDTVSLFLDPLYHRYWPQQTDSRFSNESVAVGDVDDDGAPEMVASEGMRVCGGALGEGRCGAYGMKVHAWKSGGQLIPGWPRMPGSDNWVTTPALVDMDGDGTQEIIVGSIDGRVYAYHHDGTMMAGWPQDTTGAIHHAPACADLDGDGTPEIAVGDDAGHVFVWHGDGTLLSGWPREARGQAFSPLLADLDADGVKEIAVTDASGRVSVWRTGGAPLPGWPITVPSPFVNSCVAGDLNGDRHPEIVALTEDALYVWRNDASLAPGWPTDSGGGYAGSSPALADLDGDLDLEILCTNQRSQLEVWSHAAQAVSGWEGNPGGALSSPIVGDIDGDAHPEVIVGSGDYSNTMYAYHWDGSAVDGWPRRIPQRDTPYPHWNRRTSASLADIDGDGRTELAVAVEGYVYLWDTNGLPKAPWPTFRSDMQRTGKAHIERNEGYLPLIAKLA